MNANVIQSAGWIVYYMDADGKPRFLLIKRHAMSGKIERVAPKGKVQQGEKAEQAAIREVSEETWIETQHLLIRQKIGSTSLRSTENQKWRMDKDVTYFLMHYDWDPSAVSVQLGEGYLGIYKRATINEVLGLIYYQNMRELFIEADNVIQNLAVKDNFVKNL